jgi:hypothetical protein
MTIIKHFWVTMAMNCQDITCCMNISYVEGHCIMRTLRVLKLLSCGYVKCSILDIGKYSRLFLGVKVHNEELRDLCSSPSIIRIIKSRKMR